jgi:uncharacterized membrane protein
MIELGKTSFWLDEAASSMLAQSEWHTFTAALYRAQANMALYYLLLRWWSHLGNSEAWLRLLSVAFGVAAIPILYKLARVIFDDRTARIAAFLMSVNVFHIRYSQEARGYSLVVFLAILCCYGFVRMLILPNKAIQAAYVITSVLMVYAHVFGVWILIAQWAYATLLSTPSKGRRIVWIPASFICVLISPLMFSLLVISDRSQLSWMTRASATSLHEFFVDLSGNGGTALLVLYVSLLCLSLRSSVCNMAQQPTDARLRYVFVWAWLFFPVFIVEGLSVRQPIFQARYLLICLPAFLLLAADGLTHLRCRPIFYSALITIIVISFMGLMAYYRGRIDFDHADNWRDATNNCLFQIHTGDAVLFTYSAEEIPFRVYQHRFGKVGLNVALLPRETELKLLSTRGVWADARETYAAMSNNHRLWLITALQANAHSTEAESALKTRFNEDSRERFGSVTVRLFVFNGDQTPPDPIGNTHKP